MTPTPLAQADAAIDKATWHLTRYIETKIREAGNDYRLAEKTGIPRSTINDALRRGGVLALRKLAYRLAAPVK